jgi:hypothetical protein
MTYGIFPEAGGSESGCPLGSVISIDERDQEPSGLVRGTVEETLHALVDRGADGPCNARRLSAMRPAATPGLGITNSVF